MSLELWIGCAFLTVLTMCIIIENITADTEQQYEVDLQKIKAVCSGAGAVLFVAAATDSLPVAASVGVILFFIFWYTKETGW